MDTYEETSNGTIPNSTSSLFRSNKAFLKASARQQQQQLNANNINVNSSSTDSVVSDDNKNPIILTSDGLEFPVHECVFKGDVRRLSSLIRTHSITQKDVHGDFSHFHSLIEIVSKYTTSGTRECMSRSSFTMHLFQGTPPCIWQ